jgi:hypothetical protein
MHLSACGQVISKTPVCIGWSAHVVGRPDGSVTVTLAGAVGALPT